MRRHSGAVNVPIALVSVLIALLLWLAVFPHHLYRRSATYSYVGLTAINLDSKFYAYVPDTIPLHAKVTDEEDGAFGKRPPTAVVDLTNAKPGRAKYPLSLYPSSFQDAVLLYDPDPRVEISIEPLANVDMPVVPDKTGKLTDPSLDVNDMTVEPKQVKLKGPESVVNTVKTVRATLDLSRVDPLAPQPIEVTLKAFDANNVLVADKLEIVPTRVSVTPYLSASPSSKQVFVDAKFTGKVPDGYAVKGFTVEPNPITASGSGMALKGVTSISTQLIDVTQLTSTQTLTVQVVVPAGVKLNVREVQVTVRIEPVMIKNLNPKTGGAVTKSNGP